MKFNQGFTLIELVVVIALLGILATAALPRMVTNYDSAHSSSVTATGGALASAVILLRSQWVTNGARGAVDQVQGYGESNIASTNAGWPSDANKDEASNHNAVVAGDHNRCVRLWVSLLISSAPSVASNRNNDTDYVVQADQGSVCKFTYIQNDQNSRIEYNLANGSVITIL